MTYEPLHHKYRPQAFSELVGQEAIATTLTNALRQQRIAPAYLFTGARGTGKTSSARILAKSLNCLKSDVPTEQPCGVCQACREIARGAALDVIEIDAASNTGVDNIRELIERAQFAPVQCRYKVYVIDECHMLSTAAFNALLKTLEEPPDRVVFVLATTDPQRVLPTIISRCQRFDFRRIPLEAMVKHLQLIADKEAIAITPDAIQLVAQIAQGGLRDAESLLDQLSLLAGEVTVEQVWDLVGSVPEQDLLMLLEAIAQDNPETVLDSLRRLMDRGREPLIVLQNLASFYRDLLIAKTAPGRNDLIAMTPSTWEKLCQFASGLEIAMILAGQQHLRSAEVQLKNTTQPRLWLEVTLMGLLPSALSQPLEARSPINKPLGRTSDTLATQPSPVSGKSAPIGDRSALTAAVPAIERSNASLHSDAPETKPQPQKPEPRSAATDPQPSLVRSNSTPTQLPGLQLDLEEAWQQVLQHIDLPGTRSILSGYCYLIKVTGQEAAVGIKTPNMLKMVRGMIPQLEAACAKTFRTKIKVQLEVVAAAPPKNPTPKAEPDIVPPVQGNPDQTQNVVPPAPYTPPLEVIQKPSVSPARPTVENFSQSSGSLLEREEEIERFRTMEALKSFAYAFNGTIVSLDEDIEPTRTYAAKNSSTDQAMAQPLEPEEQEEDDDDVPF